MPYSPFSIPWSIPYSQRGATVENRKNQVAFNLRPDEFPLILTETITELGGIINGGTSQYFFSIY